MRQFDPRCLIAYKPNFCSEKFATCTCTCRLIYSEWFARFKPRLAYASAPSYNGVGLRRTLFLSIHHAAAEG